MQREQAQTKASVKGYRFGATRPRPAGRQDGGHHGSQDGVTVRVFGSRRPTLVKISVLDVPLQNGRCWRPSRLRSRKRTRASIYRDSHHSRQDDTSGICDQILPKQSLTTHPQEHPSRGCSSFVLFIISPRGNPHTKHWSRVLHHNGGLN